MTEYTVEVDGIDYTVEATATLDGKYYPATRKTPEENPDLIIEVTRVYNDNGELILDTIGIEQKIIDALYETSEFYNDLYERAASQSECQEPDEDLHPSRGER